MSLKHLNAPDAAPAPPGARYSHAVEAGPFLYVTGQLPVDPDDMEAPMPEAIETQTRLVFKNLERIVEHAGGRLADTVFARVYLTDFKRDYPGMNKVYAEYFPDDARLPGRTTVGVTALARDARVEIDLVVHKG
ncbi:RidA family protein [Pelagibius sp. CAU 1746]|uniref:RidA family protein n=1 Tax=Pelagibius sp. CAU 1746 TaxID=3140370 RepID=UPI00325AA4AA